MSEKLHYKLAFICLLAVLLFVAQNMSAQVVSRGSASGSTNDKAVFIADTPGDTTRWAKIRDIFLSPADRKKALAPGLIRPDDENQPTEEDEAASEAEKPEVLPRVSGIIIGEKNDVSALINDYPVKKGDFVDDYLVKKISRSSVTLEKNGKEYVLYVQQ